MSAPSTLSAPLLDTDADAEAGEPAPEEQLFAPKPSSPWRRAKTAAAILGALAVLAALSVFVKPGDDDDGDDDSDASPVWWDSDSAQPPPIAEGGSVTSGDGEEPPAKGSATDGDNSTAGNAAYAQPFGVPSVSGPTYESVQFVGFNLFTAPGSTADGCFGKAGEELQHCYLGSEVTDKDILTREDIMMKAIDRAYASSNWRRDAQTLKVFVAPEFFWRGAHGAYRLDPNASARSRSLVRRMTAKLESPRFQHWLFVLGTVVAAQHSHADIKGEPNIKYYNFAPLQLGGTNQSFVQFKHFISGIDFLRADVAEHRSKLIRAPPGHFSPFCREHPHASGCVYQMAPPNLLAEFGFGQHHILEDGVLRIGGLKIGMEICLDHYIGELCSKHMAEKETVDLQIIASAGMAIATGPVCTPPGGPVFLTDGFARTELSLNMLGHGREAALMPDGRRRRYDVGLVYGADALMSLQQDVTDTTSDFISNATGIGFGSHFPGVGTLPSGSATTGASGVTFSQISALGDDWLEQLSGFFDVAPYLQARKIGQVLEKSLSGFLRKEHGGLDWSTRRAGLYPTLDFYGPFTIPGRGGEP